MTYMDLKYPCWRKRLADLTLGTDITAVITACNTSVTDFLHWLDGTATPTLNQLDTMCLTLHILFEDLTGAPR